MVMFANGMVRVFVLQPPFLGEDRARQSPASLTGLVLFSLRGCMVVRRGLNPVHQPNVRSSVLVLIWLVLTLAFDVRIRAFRFGCSAVWRNLRGGLPDVLQGRLWAFVLLGTPPSRHGSGVGYANELPEGVRGSPLRVERRPPNKRMKLTKLSAARWRPEWTCRLMPAPARTQTRAPLRSLCAVFGGRRRAMARTVALARTTSVGMLMRSRRDSKHAMQAPGCAGSPGAGAPPRVESLTRQAIGPANGTWRST